MTSHKCGTGWHCTFLRSAFPFCRKSNEGSRRSSLATPVSRALMVSVAIILRLLCWKSLLKTAAGLIKTITRSSVTAVILYGQPHGLETMRSALPHNASFRAAVSEIFMLRLLGTDASLVSSSGYLSPPLSLTCFLSLFLALSLLPPPLSFPYVSVSLVFPLFFSLLIFSVCSSPSSCQMSLLGFPLPFLQWNTRSRPGGDSHKFRLRVTHFGLERENECIHGQQPCCLPQGMLQRERKKSCFRRTEH